jgi:pilus assembly protein CpaF
MRPDRIILGECRRGEAFDMLQAMNTGHEGSMTTIHANSPRDALSRLETLCLLAGIDLPVVAIRRQVAEAVDVLVQTKRFRDGKRRVTAICEITGMEGDTITTQDIFTCSPDGSQFKCTGFVTTLLERLKDNGVELPAGFFA